MIELEIDVPTPAGTMNTVVMHPEDGGPFPVAICFMDSCGVRPDFLDMPRRLAAAGYCVATPNMYYRKFRSVDLNPDRIDSDKKEYDDERKLMWELNKSFTLMECASDTRALLDWLGDYAPALRGPAGAYGYCLGGRLALGMAAHVPERIAAAASFHGGGFVVDTPESIHRHADKIRAEVYVAHAGTDKYVPAQQLTDLDEALAQAGVRRRLEIYSEAHHGFTIAGRDAYHERSAFRAWERLFALFRRNLPQAPTNGDAPAANAPVASI
ncbi:MAG TPA: dienelactone hydrolase family protein [Caulobacteraceae bacterium]|jgi:carboxymethylenebutenolidase|nr:dienelactone hydrolase family protein [Caulobacteraceae bacterium]